MDVPHPIPYQGSKRWLARPLLQCFPQSVKVLFEPFAGSAAVTLAAAASERAKSFVISDINAPLMALWDRIVNDPQGLASEYDELWHEQLGREGEYFNLVRARFNRSHRPADLLYLLARCTKAAIRYNRRGAFNNSPDHRRKGARPETMRAHIIEASRLLRTRAELIACDFREALVRASADDLVYMDPPYQGVSGERDQRYLKGLALNELASSLDDLNRRGIPYILSYDGRTGEKTHGKPLPRELGLTHIEVVAGRSTTETLLGRAGITVESIHLSPALMARIGSVPSSLLPRKKHPALFEMRA